MRVEALKEEKLQTFIEYCKKYRKDIDDSFLYDEDLKEFTPSEENPTYIIVNEDDDIVAAASLIRDEYMKRGKKGRFRIFHSSIKQLKLYKMLLEAVSKHTDGLDKLVIFVPIVNEELSKIMKKLLFKVERYSFLLVRENIIVPRIELPEGYSFKDFEEGKDEEDWCTIRNKGFENLLGNETPITPEMVVKMNSGEDCISGGAMFLYHGEKPVGVIRGAKDEYEDKPIMNIGPLAILPEYQGKGLGRMLLRKVIKFGRENGYMRTVLSVNAENVRAKLLYIQEGFEQVEAVVCYKYEV